MKIIGYLSNVTGRVYTQQSSLMGAETKAANKEFASKLDQLQSKFNRN